MKHPDVCIAGAGIIGLTLALALHRRSLSVAVLSAGDPMAEASTAAAGMLAVDDPDNPPALLALSRFSRSLYPALLASLGRTEAFFQTHRTLQHLLRQTSADSAGARDVAAALRSFLPNAAPGEAAFADLMEESVDPRELAAALIEAVHRSGVELRPATPVLTMKENAASVEVRLRSDAIDTGEFIDCTGAWSLSSAHLPSLQVVPRKGQMLTVATPPSLAAGVVLRSHEIYLVPRLHGPRAGETVIGATVEDAGFDRTLDHTQLRDLLARAATLLPEVRDAGILSSWSGLRPATADLLPVLGRLPGSHRLSIASGHYRNGILLAPGTAEVMAQSLVGEAPGVSLAAFAPGRFHRATNGESVG